MRGAEKRAYNWVSGTVLTGGIQLTAGGAYLGEAATATAAAAPLLRRRACVSVLERTFTCCDGADGDDGGGGGRGRTRGEAS